MLEEMAPNEALCAGSGERKLPLPVPSSGASWEASLSFSDPTCRTGGAIPSWQSCALVPRSAACLREFCWKNKGVYGWRVLCVPCKGGWTGHIPELGLFRDSGSFLGSLWSCNLKNLWVYSEPTTGSRETGPSYSRVSPWEQISPVQMLSAS